jgi:hypothetical protein
VVGATDTQRRRPHQILDRLDRGRIGRHHHLEAPAATRWRVDLPLEHVPVEVVRGDVEPDPDPDAVLTVGAEGAVRLRRQEPLARGILLGLDAHEVGEVGGQAQLEAHRRAIGESVQLVVVADLGTDTPLADEHRSSVAILVERRRHRGVQRGRVAARRPEHVRLDVVDDQLVARQQPQVAAVHAVEGADLHAAAGVAGHHGAAGDERDRGLGRDLADGWAVGHPLTPVAATPWMKNRWNTRKTISTGSVVSIEPAIATGVLSDSPVA